MRMTQDAIADLRAEVLKGVEDLRNGNYVEYTDETLHELVTEIGDAGVNVQARQSQHDEG